MIVNIPKEAFDWARDISGNDFEERIFKAAYRYGHLMGWNHHKHMPDIEEQWWVKDE